MNTHSTDTQTQHTRLVASTSRGHAENFSCVINSYKASRTFIFAAFLLVMAISLSCLKCRAEEPAMTNGQILQASQIASQLSAMCGDDAYAVVQTQWLKWYYEKFRSDLAQGPMGIVRWYDTFDCNRFAAKFAADAQVRFFSHSFHTFTQAKALAVGEFWYQPAKAARPHAIVFAFTERGLVFIDPQTGKFVPLTVREINSHMLAKI